MRRKRWLAGGWAAGDSRRTFVSQWYNNAGHWSAVSDYGTQDSDLARPDACPGTGGSTQIVTMYDGYGRQSKVTDNAGTAVKSFFDDAGRAEVVVRNWQPAEWRADGDYSMPRSVLGQAIVAAAKGLFTPLWGR